MPQPGKRETSELIKESLSSFSWWGVGVFLRCCRSFPTAVSAPVGRQPTCLGQSYNCQGITSRENMSLRKESLGIVHSALFVSFPELNSYRRRLTLLQSFLTTFPCSEAFLQLLSLGYTYFLSPHYCCSRGCPALDRFLVFDLFFVADDRDQGQRAEGCTYP